ncbi:MAG: hypothetical protein HOJ79_12880 [Nitrospina sp.]|nr:hypothetical protein [Nitrospina sp.]
MEITNKSRAFLIILTLVASMLSVNLTLASMHHMDDADCMIQTTCNSCFISATNPLTDLSISFSVSSQAWEASNFSQPYQTSPSSPPPKL